MESRSTDEVVDGRTTVLVRPVGDGPWPGVVMLHEAWGIDDVLRRQADRLARAGYLVAAPDLLGDGLWLRCVQRTFKALQAGQGRPFDLVDACRQWLAARADCTGRIGVIGFCMGGGFALLLSTRGYSVSSVNYGMVPRDPEQALAGACPIIASYGGRDKQFAPGAAVLEDVLTRLDVRHDVRLYPKAGHSFLNDAPNGPLLARPLMKVIGAGPEPESAADAWRRIEGFFAEHLAD